MARIGTLNIGTGPRTDSTLTEVEIGPEGFSAYIHQDGEPDDVIGITLRRAYEGGPLVLTVTDCNTIGGRPGELFSQQL